MHHELTFTARVTTQVRRRATHPIAQMRTLYGRVYRCLTILPLSYTQHDVLRKG
jgi:hypothetical protein